jgi:hypothetical protein
LPNDLNKSARALNGPQACSKIHVGLLSKGGKKNTSRSDAEDTTEI